MYGYQSSESWLAGLSVSCPYLKTQNAAANEQFTIPIFWL